MQISFRSRHGLPQVSVLNFVDAKDNDLRLWKNGETRNIPDDRMVRFRMSLNSREDIRSVRAVDAILDMGPDFVDPATGINPDFACAVCGRESLDLHFHHVAAGGEITVIPYRTEDGKPICMHDFLVAHPEYLAQHVIGGLPMDEAEAIKNTITERDHTPDAPYVPPAAAVPAQQAESVMTEPVSTPDAPAEQE
jgi:hypothetical protein